jgi:DNA invertase Pin-like site-specific DNA recombinase
LKTALYLRVSTRDQNLENQRLELTSVALSRGWQIVATYTDTISGSTRRDKRPGMREMLDDAKRPSPDRKSWRGRGYLATI